MHRSLVFILAFYFQVERTTSQTVVISNDSLNQVKKEKIDSLVKTIIYSYPNEGRYFNGKSEMGEVTGYYTITNEGTICRIICNFNQKEKPKASFFYDKDSLIMIQIAENRSYYVDNLVAYIAKMPDTYVSFLQNLLVFERKQFEMIKMLKN